MPVPRITKEELKARLESADQAARPCLIDVRLKYPYEHSTLQLPGAHRVSPSQPDLAKLPRDRDVVAYDSDPDEVTGSRVAAMLVRQGYRVSVLKGGIGEWIEAKFPVEPRDGTGAAGAGGAGA